MANGRQVISRRRRTATARNNKPRIGSKEGIEVRAEIRAKHTPPDTHDRKLTYTKAGSRNPRKVGR